ncbi:MAG: response regulator, partial [Blastopirellula sp. JB062]
TRWWGALVNGGYRVAILDIEMPQLNGLEALEQIKRFDSTTSVIMLTGYVKMNFVLEALRLGAEYCLFKPLDDLQPLLDALDASFRRIDHWRTAAAFAARQLRIQKQTSAIKTKLQDDDFNSPSLAGQLPTSFDWRQFEEYLVRQGAITPEILELVRATYARTVKPIGQIALNLRLLGIAQLMQVLERQADSQTMFGETAIELGFLTPDQVDRLLQQQQRQSTTPQDAIFRVGAMTPEALNRYLAQYLRQLENSSLSETLSSTTTGEFAQLTTTLD